MNNRKLERATRESLADYNRLHDFLSELIESGRLDLQSTKPNEQYTRLVAILTALAGKEDQRRRAEHPETDEHLAACPACMMAHDKGLPD